MLKSLSFAIALILVPAAAHGVAPTVVLPISPVESALSPVAIPLAVLGIDPDTVTVTGALRGTVYRDGDQVFYAPDPLAFQETYFDLLRVATPEGPAVLNVGVVQAESGLPMELVSHAGYTAVADPGWGTEGAAAWDPASGSYLVTGKGEIEFDFLRDDVSAWTVDVSGKGGQSGSGSSVTLRPPPPNAPFVETSPLLMYQGGSEGGVWELWLHSAGGGHQLEVVLASGLGAESTTVPLPEAPEVGVELDARAGEVLLRLTAGGAETDHYPLLPPGFGLDRTWHRFGNLDGDDQRSIELAELRVVRTSLDLARQVVVVDDFDAPSWSEAWTSPEAGALKVGPAILPRSDGDGLLVVSVDRAAEVGPDYLARTLEVPRVAMTCRFGLDLSSLSSFELGSGGATLLVFRDASLEATQERDFARLLARAEGQDRQVRLVGGGMQAAATPWISLPGHSATLEVQWRKTAPDQSRLDLWIDGCGPAGQPCEKGWEVTGIPELGLVNEVRLGILGGFYGSGGEVRFDDVACAGDSWVEPES